MRLTTLKLQYKEDSDHIINILTDIRYTRIYCEIKNLTGKTRPVPTKFPHEGSYLLHTKYWPELFYAFSPSADIWVKIKLIAIGSSFRPIPKVKYSSVISSLELDYTNIGFINPVTKDYVQIAREDSTAMFRSIDLNELIELEWKRDIDDIWNRLIILPNLPKTPKISGIIPHELPICLSNRREAVTKSELKNIRINLVDKYSMQNCEKFKTLLQLII